MTLTRAALACLAVLAAAAPATVAGPQVPVSEPGTEGVRGTMLGPDYEPLVGYRVRVVAADGSAVLSGPIDSKGRFWVGALASGRYEVQLVSPERRLCDAEIPPVDVGDNRELSFSTVLPEAPECAGPSVLDEAPPGEAPPDEPPGPGRRSKRVTRILVATGLGLGTLLVLDDDSDEGVVSPVLP